MKQTFMNTNKLVNKAIGLMRFAVLKNLGSILGGVISFSVANRRTYLIFVGKIMARTFPKKTKPKERAAKPFFSVKNTNFTVNMRLN